MWIVNREHTQRKTAGDVFLCVWSQHVSAIVPFCIHTQLLVNPFDSNAHMFVFLFVPTLRLRYRSAWDWLRTLSCPLLHGLICSPKVHITRGRVWPVGLCLSSIGYTSVCLACLVCLFTSIWPLHKPHTLICMVLYALKHRPRMSMCSPSICTKRQHAAGWFV